MRFAVTAEQRQFGAALHGLLADADVAAAARAWATGDHEPGLAIWRELAKLGVTALTVPESFGGLGAEPVDLVVACEELGHHPLPGPIAESIAAVPHVLTTVATAGSAGATGSAAGLAADWLAALASGDLVATLALPPLLPYALDADAAGLVLLADGTALWQATPQARLESADRARRLFEVRPDQPLAPWADTEPALRQAAGYGTLASAALLLGAGRGLLEASTGYAKTREQFGRPVGAFQAVKHALADTAIGLEFARPLLYAAAIALGAGATSTARDISAARVACAQAARHAARVALQVHGAIGYTLECDISLWLAKIRSLSCTWGSQSEHRAVVLAALGQDGAGPWN
ncbi:MAG TPA: acyl-CoA dehydrogenase family protein [Streptosporangiaceae bacterium]|nr:acyl-CoA dehydrogenase family protein [Streptosporangiaceae bacterium]